MDRRIGERGEQKRRWDRENQHECSEEGCTTLVGRHRTRCRSCHAAAERRRRDERRARIAALWAEGLTLAAIAAALGTTRGTVAVEVNRMRRDGWDLPLRQRPRRRG